MFFRNCPKCGLEISHTNKIARNNAQRWNRHCRECGLNNRDPMKNPKIYPAKCQQCGKERMYSSPGKIVVTCKSCSTKNSHIANPDRLKGCNNPMFGKNPLANMSKIKMRELSEKRSKNAIGKNNPMYGKPSPIKSGRGISGRWQGVHFRSLLELAFLEKFERDFGRLPQTAETSQYRIALDDSHNYFPDFFDDGLIFEIKPSRLLNTPENSRKIEAGKSIYGEKFVVITEKELDNYKGISKRLTKFEGLYLNKRTC